MCILPVTSPISFAQHAKKHYKRKGTRQEVSEKVLEGRKGWNQLNCKTWGNFNESNTLSFAQTHMQFGIMHIPDAFQIKSNFDGLQVVHDPRTTEEQLSIASNLPC